MTNWLINSAVMPAGAYGVYSYQPATLDELNEYVQHGPVSRIGYAETADRIAAWTGVRPDVIRAEYEMRPGDRAIVVRLRYRVADPKTKGRQTGTSDEDWEIAWLTRVN